MVSTLLFAAALCVPQGESPFRIVDVPQPKEIVLEVGGILPRGDTLFVCTRRGEVWRIDDAYGASPRYVRWAEGLQEPLGLLDDVDGKAILVSQRGELSRMSDDDGDGRMDRLATLASGWPLSGNYHEYCFGPTRTPDGALWLTLNKPFGDEPFGVADWRGFAIRCTPDGGFEAVCAGLRSPAGVATAPWGEVFYTDNQGEWCPTSKLAMLEPGSFHGHPHGIESCKLPQSKVAHPGEIESGLREEDFAKRHPSYRLPAVWIPYDLLGRSPSGFVWDESGRFGPYRGSIFAGDQYSCEVMRLTIEKVAGRWQGACYPFVTGLKSGITRVAWGSDGSLICGLTDRGWTATGTARDGLQRIVWNREAWDRAPVFDLLEVRATPRGFALQFSVPVDAATAQASALRVKRWTYDHHSEYGCKERGTQELAVEGVTLSDDGLRLDLVVPERRAVWVHELRIDGLRARDGGAKPWHEVAWYTLNAIPAGD
ncbi:MAG: hypothetical protein IT457_08005 [Planctomycetes bacterium]|nr:hypothetical protein [Planctomycetota bacterium]